MAAEARQVGIPFPGITGARNLSQFAGGLVGEITLDSRSCRLIARCGSRSGSRSARSPLWRWFRWTESGCYATSRWWSAGSMLAGSDASPDTTPWLHRELELFVEAGLAPAEALRTATLNPAEFFNATDSLGTVASNKLVDLVLLDADPLADIHNTTKVYAVIANGRYFDHVALDTLLAGVERRGASHWVR